MRRISNLGTEILRQFMLDLCGFFSFEIPCPNTVFDLCHYGFDVLIIVKISHCAIVKALGVQNMFSLKSQI